MKKGKQEKRKTRSYFKKRKSNGTKIKSMIDDDNKINIIEEDK